ncbi:UNVERIFIED_CONTAM: PAX-interacting protein 1 [Trichonephila clavipes]
MRESKRCVTAYWLNDTLEKKKLKYPWLAHHFPTPFSDDKPCKNQIISMTNFEGEERNILKNIITILGAKYTNYLSIQNTIVICKKNEGRKALKAREWRIPLVNVQWLHDLMFGHIDALRLSMAHKYQQYDSENPFAVDYALVPHLMSAWKFPVKISEELIKKYNIEPKTPDNAASAEKDPKKRENEENIEPEAKRIRVESPPLEENIPLTTQTPPDNENNPRVLFTGIAKIKELAKIVCQLGGCLAKSETETTHLVASQYARTVKFLCAIHVVKYVVTPEWIAECEKQNKFVDEKEYILRDLENEKMYSFNLENVLNREERTPIFKDFVFFITAGVIPKADILKKIIEAGSGTPVFKKAPTLKQIKSVEQTGQKFVVITCENDLHLCKMYQERKICVQNVEFILTCSIRQELDFSSFAYAL